MISDLFYNFLSVLLIALLFTIHGVRFELAFCSLNSYLDLNCSMLVMPLHPAVTARYPRLAVLLLTLL